MGLTQEYAQKWKWLKSQVNLVQDKTLRIAMMAEFRKRALRDWSFDPEDGRITAKNESVELDSWEEEFVNDIKKANMFEINTRANKQKQTAKEAHARMMMFIEQGGRLEDIPDDIRSNTIDNLYHECLIEYGNQMIEQADSLIGVAK